MQEEGHDGLSVMPDKPVKLHAMGQGRKSALQIPLPIAVEVPFAPKLPKLGEGDQGEELTTPQRLFGTGAYLFWRQVYLAKVVHYDIQYGQEGVHVDHESAPLLQIGILC